MGQFSWFTQDTNHRIVNGKPYRVIMTDDKGNQFIETCYEGYGEFGGKDYYELVAEMNGYKLEQFRSKDELRSKGISLAFHNSKHGNNTEIIYPSLSENGEYFGGVQPDIDPHQGFSDNEFKNIWYL